MSKRTVGAWEVTVGMSLHYMFRCKPAQGIVTKVVHKPKDRVFIVLTSGNTEVPNCAIFDLVEVT